MKLSLQSLLAKRRQRVHPFFLIGVSLGIVLLLAGILLGLQTIRSAHADTQQITEDIYLCASYRKPDGTLGFDVTVPQGYDQAVWKGADGNQNVTVNGNTFAINGYKGQRGVKVTGTLPAGASADTLSGSNQCSGYFAYAWDQQQAAMVWEYTFHNKPKTDVCTAKVYIPSWYAGATMAQYTLGNNLGQTTTATLNQDPISGQWATPQWQGQYAAGISVGTDTGQGDVTLALELQSSNEPKYLAADAVDFQCTMTVTVPSAPTPTPTPTTSSSPHSPSMAPPSR